MSALIDISITKISGKKIINKTILNLESNCSTCCCKYIRRFGLAFDFTYVLNKTIFDLNCRMARLLEFVQDLLTLSYTNLFCVVCNIGKTNLIIQTTLSFVIQCCISVISKPIKCYLYSHFENYIRILSTKQLT